MPFMADSADDKAKVEEYLQVVRDRILVPIETTDVRRSCTATLMLLFAAIDGLGYLLHDNERARNNERIGCFLDYMGGAYSAHKEKLLLLRNGLMHSVINTGSYLSRTETGGKQHIVQDGDDLVFVKTLVMFRDFKAAFERYWADLEHDPALLRRAGERLVEHEVDDPLDVVLDDDGPHPTPEPPVRFKFGGPKRGS
jgi:hypothetical protein